MLSVFGRARKKKEMLTVIEKKPPKHISNNCRQVRVYFLKRIKGRKSSPAKKNRIKARVKGGMLVRASLKMGAAAPQMIFVIMRATTGFMYI